MGRKKQEPAEKHFTQLLLEVDNLQKPPNRKNIHLQPPCALKSIIYNDYRIATDLIRLSARKVGIDQDVMEFLTRLDALDPGVLQDATSPTPPPITAPIIPPDLVVSDLIPSSEEQDYEQIKATLLVERARKQQQQAQAGSHQSNGAALGAPSHDGAMPSTSNAHHLPHAAARVGMDGNDTNQQDNQQQCSDQHQYADAEEVRHEDATHTTEGHNEEDVQDIEEDIQQNEEDTQHSEEDRLDNEEEEEEEAMREIHTRSRFETVLRRKTRLQTAAQALDSVQYRIKHGYDRKDRRFRTTKLEIVKAPGPRGGHDVITSTSTPHGNRDGYDSAFDNSDEEDEDDSNGDGGKSDGGDIGDGGDGGHMHDEGLQGMHDDQQGRQGGAMPGSEANGDDGCKDTQSQQQHHHHHHHQQQQGLSVPAAAPAIRLPADELLLQVQLNHPEIVSRPPEFWLVPMSLPLSALRDALYCVTDVNINNMNPQASSKNSYFYIEGAFFLDTRHTEGFEDYSQPLREFCKKHRIAAPADAAEVYPAGVGVDAMGFGVGSMERVCFGDLVLQVNSPRFNYYFCHQGVCEHPMVIPNIRRIHAADPQYLHDYPVRLTPLYKKTRNCNVCATRRTDWVTYGDPFADADPFFWCDECFCAMHLDEEGNLLSSDFQVFKYVHE